jgi:tetratricopeptide (TPR) repeat protein
MISINDVFSWLNEFQGSGLTRPDTILRDIIRQKITERRFFEAYQVIGSLKSYENNRINSFERGEIWVECGLAFYEMGNSTEAIKSLERAKSEYPPESHAHAVVRWMLGTMQWFFEKNNAEAIKNCKRAIEEFRILEEKAEQERRVREKDWYSDRIIEMEESLSGKITEKFS